ncbi:unnamed protein product, partial [Brugia timori]|uniref:BAG domain-containing protein n=1 Tax=Brugia timori TaxID=42155 RepID=A0A0R3QIH8_9BILA
MASDSETESGSNGTNPSNAANSTIPQSVNGVEKNTDDHSSPMDVDGNISPGTELSFLITQCRIASGDLNLSQELIETGISTNDTDMVKNELTDIDKCVVDFNTPHAKLVDLCQRKKLDITEHEDRRKKFLLTLKILKVKISKFLSTSGSTESAENG